MTTARQDLAASGLRGAAEVAASDWAGPLDPETAARAAGQLHAAVRWLCTAMAALTSGGTQPILNQCLQHLLSAWQRTAAIRAPESGQGTGQDPGDLLCAAARDLASGCCQQPPAPDQHAAAGLAGATAALAAAARILAAGQPGTLAAASLGAAAECLDSASALLDQVPDGGPGPAGRRRSPCAVRRPAARQAGQR